MSTHVTCPLATYGGSIGPCFDRVLQMHGIGHAQSNNHSLCGTLLDVGSVTRIY